MNHNVFSWESFKKTPLIGIIRGLSFDEVKEVLPVYQQSGLTTIEITMNTAGFSELLPYALAHFPGLNIGAGTVCTPEELTQALGLGAQFIVTPIAVKKVIKTCKKAGVPIFPGAFTPTEIYHAWSWGASMVKVYPAVAVGPSYIRDIKAPLTAIKLLPTGGVNLENIGAFKEAGADGFGIGSQLFQPVWIKEKNWNKLKQHFEAYVNAL